MTVMAERSRSSSPTSYLDSDGLARLGGYARYIADRVYLRDWQIEVLPNPDIDDPARIFCVPRRKLARVEIGLSFHEATPQQQRHFIVHEFVHSHLEPVRTCLDTVERAVGETTYGVIKRNHDNALEAAGDELARAIAAGLPTPDEWAAAQAGKAGRR